MHPRGLVGDEVDHTESWMLSKEPGLGFEGSEEPRWVFEQGHEKVLGGVAV